MGATCTVNSLWFAQQQQLPLYVLVGFMYNLNCALFAVISINITDLLTFANLLVDAREKHGQSMRNQAGSQHNVNPVYSTLIWRSLIGR